MPSNGARTAMRARRAWAKASCAWATFRLAALVSSACCARNFSVTSSWVRLKLASAMASWACICWRSASCSWSSNCTRICPLRTGPPSLKLSAVMRPTNSGRSITLWRARKLPTAWASSRNACTATLATSTPTTRDAPEPVPDGLAALLPAPVMVVGASGRDCSHQAAAPAKPIPTTATAAKVNLEAIKIFQVKPLNHVTGVL